MRVPSAIPPREMKAVPYYLSRGGGTSPGLRVLVSRVELGELSHEGRGDIGVDLAIEKNGAFGPPQHRPESAQLVEGANGVRLKAECLRHRREVHVREH